MRESRGVERNRGRLQPVRQEGVTEEWSPTLSQMIEKGVMTACSGMCSLSLVIIEAAFRLGCVEAVSCGASKAAGRLGRGLLGSSDHK